MFVAQDRDDGGGSNGTGGGENVDESLRGGGRVDERSPIGVGKLQQPLNFLLLAGAIKDGETVRVSVQDGRLTINGARLAEAA